MCVGGGGGLPLILRHQPSGGEHQRGQWETLRGVGQDRTITLAASSWMGGMTNVWNETFFAQMR